MSRAGLPATSGTTAATGPPSAARPLAVRRSARDRPAVRRAGLWRTLLLVLIACAVVAVDQWSKSWALRALSDGAPRHVIGPVYLLLTFNSGAAFSLGSGASPVIEAIAIALIVGVIAFSRRAAKGGANLAVIVGLGLLLGGALSNVGDRVFRPHHGAVVDFIQLVSWWPIFNVADASITVGAVTVVVALAFFSGKSNSEERRQTLTSSSPHAQAGDLPAGGQVSGADPDPR
jgi:signal peptidase II